MWLQMFVLRIITTEMMHFLDVFWNLKVEFVYIRVNYWEKQISASFSDSPALALWSLPTQEYTDNTGKYSHEPRVRAIEDDMRLVPGETDPWSVQSSLSLLCRRRCLRRVSTMLLAARDVRVILEVHRRVTFTSVFTCDAGTHLAFVCQLCSSWWKKSISLTAS
jgi:hypothetical protein